MSIFESRHYAADQVNFFSAILENRRSFHFQKIPVTLIINFISLKIYRNLPYTSKTNPKKKILNLNLFNIFCLLLLIMGKTVFDLGKSKNKHFSEFLMLLQTKEHTLLQMQPLKMLKKILLLLLILLLHLSFQL